MSRCASADDEPERSAAARLAALRTRRTLITHVRWAERRGELILAEFYTQLVRELGGRLILADKGQPESSTGSRYIRGHRSTNTKPEGSMFIRSGWLRINLQHGKGCTHRQSRGN